VERARSRGSGHPGTRPGAADVRSAGAPRAGDWASAPSFWRRRPRPGCADRCQRPRSGDGGARSGGARNRRPAQSRSPRERSRGRARGAPGEDRHLPGGSGRRGARARSRPRPRDPRPRPARRRGGRSLRVAGQAAFVCGGRGARRVRRHRGAATHERHHLAAQTGASAIGRSSAPSQADGSFQESCRSSPADSST